MRGGWALAAATVGLLTAYLVFALVLGESLFGMEIRLRHGYLVAVVVGVIAATLARRRAPSALTFVALLCGSILFSLVVVDTVWSWRATRTALLMLDAEKRDPTVGTRDFEPPRYYPTSASFTLYKPEFRISAERYGDLYSSEYSRSPTLVREVLERRRVSISIDADGFRATTPLASARILALGDSYADGPTIDQPDTWPEVLSVLVGEPVYNLGIDSASPAHEFLLLEHLVRSGRARPRHVVWMIFEGNDLEDDYDRAQRPPSAIDDTVFGTLTAIVPRMIRAQSVLARLRRGEVRWSPPATRAEGIWEVDGVPLATPLYRSRFGPVLVYLPYLDRARLPRAYVVGHPNRPLLDAVFADMKRLAGAHGFDVTVAIAPSLARLYAADLPAAGVSGTAHFIEYVAALAAGSGFGTVNLYEAMRPYAAGELLYFRDDTHWNARGNRVAAEIIARSIRW